MSGETLMWLGAAATVLIAVLGGMISYMVRWRDRLAAVKDELHSFQVYVLEHFAKGTELRETEARLTTHLERIESYLKSMAGEGHGHPCAPAKPRS